MTESFKRQSLVALFGAQHALHTCWSDTFSPLGIICIPCWTTVKICVPNTFLAEIPHPLGTDTHVLTSLPFLPKWIKIKSKVLQEKQQLFWRNTAGEDDRSESERRGERTDRQKGVSVNKVSTAVWVLSDNQLTLGSHPDTSVFLSTCGAHLTKKHKSWVAESMQHCARLWNAMCFTRRYLKEIKRFVIMSGTIKAESSA